MNRNTVAKQILKYLKSTRQHITNLDAIKITGKSSASRRMRELQENGLIQSRWNNEHTFKYYFYKEGER